MLPLVTKLPDRDHSISERIASFFDRLSKAVHPGNTAILFIEQLRALRKDFKQLELPETRDEFETRANLFRLLRGLVSYLHIKQKFKKSDVKQKIRKTGTIGQVYRRFTLYCLMIIIFIKNRLAQSSLMILP